MADETTSSKNYSNITVKDLGNSEVEIEGEISADKLAASRSKAVERMANTLDIPGFRKGKAPESVIVKHLGSDYPILEDAAEIALADEYPGILVDHSVDAIGRPEISITKLAFGNPLGFKIKTAVVPVFSLPDYKKIAQEKNAGEKAAEVTPNDVEKALQDIRRNKAHHDLHQKLGADAHDHSHPEIKDEDLPVLDDEFAKSVGKFETLDQLREKVKESLVREREREAREKTRIDIVEAISEKSNIPLPDVLVRSELEKMFAQFKEDIERAGIPFEEYLTHIKKTEDDLRQEWRPTAEKKAKFQLILNKIAAAENIEADKEMLEHEVKSLTEIYKDADPERIRIYVDTMLTNEKVFKFLEEQK